MIMVSDEEAYFLDMPTTNLELEDHTDLFHVSCVSLSELSPHSLGQQAPIA